MQYTDTEAALIGGLISNYFFQPSVDAKLRESYRRVLRHLHENTLSASDLSRIQNALTFLSPLCRDTREAHKHDGRDIKNRCSAESQQINDHPLNWQRVLCFLASQHRQYAVFSSWSGMGLACGFNV